jgi:hypothetical protein
MGKNLRNIIIYMDIIDDKEKVKNYYIQNEVYLKKKMFLFTKSKFIKKNYSYILS